MGTEMAMRANDDAYHYFEVCDLPTCTDYIMEK